MRPDWAVGISNQELRAIAAHEGKNPYVGDWGARIDPVIIKEAKQGRFKVPGQEPIEQLRNERARLRDELKEANDRLDEELQLPPADIRAEALEPRVAAPLRIQRPRPSGIPIEASTAEEAARLRQSVRESLGLPSESLAPVARTPATTAEEVAHVAAVVRKEVPPDDPAKLLQRVSLPEGKPRLSDPPSFAQEVGVSTIKNRAARAARVIAVLPAVRPPSGGPWRGLQRARRSPR